MTGDYEESFRQFRDALYRQPSNEHSIDRYARACEGCAKALEERDRNSTEARVLREKRKHWIRKACDLPSPHADTFFSRGFLELEEANQIEVKEERLKKLSEAQEYFVLALKKNPNHRHAGFMLEYVKYIQDPDGYEPPTKKVEWKGNNALYHRFFFLLKVRKWVEAAEVAGKLQAVISSHPENERSDYDKEILAKIHEFIVTLLFFSSQQ